MAEAARTTRHYVSDSLAERYPYNASNGFAGARQKDTGAVFNGYDVLGTANLINSLTDPFVNAEGKAKAAHYLYSRSASQEAKIEMLQQGIVPLLVATLNSTTDVLLRHQCLLLLRSLAVLPQGCYALVFQGAVLPTVKSLRTAAPTSGSNTAADAAECHVAAAHVLHQISSNVSGQRWLLGLPHETAVAGLEADESVVPLLPEKLMYDVIDVLAEDRASDALWSKMAGHLLQALAQLTNLPRGVEALLTSSTALPTVAVYLTKLTAERSSSAPSSTGEQMLGEAALEIVWNVALDAAGGGALEAADVPRLLFGVFASVCDNAAVSPVPLQRQLTGALSAVHQLTSVKTASTDPLSTAENGDGNARTRIDALIQYLRQWNDTVEEQYVKLSKPVPSGVAAILKNTVQCIRLASEVKAVRDATHSILDERARADATEAFYLRRQLYFGTRWEVEYDAGVKM
jgi:hypothetical protein